MCLALTGSACGGDQRPAADSSAGQTKQRLLGKWQLLSFAPSLALEEPLKGLLDAQLKMLTISFEKEEFTAAGPGVDGGGRYEITSAEGDSLTGKVYDRAGAGYTISGQFVGQQFRFVSLDPPWTGNGVLERAP